MTRKPKRLLWSLLAIAALALAGTAYAASPDSNAKSPDWHGHERTIRLVEATAVPQPAFVDVGKPGPSVGDIVVITDDLNRPDGTKAGRMRQSCSLVELGTNPLTSTYECAASFALDEGTIVAAGPFVPATPEQKQAVTGGTGAFKTAQGEVSVRAEDDQIAISLVR
jgi:hypothetical protein